MNALVLNALKSPLVIEQRPDPRPGPTEVVVQVRAAALNRRDYWITQGLYAGIKLPIVLGSDAVGVIGACGSDVSRSFGSEEVIINPGWNWGNDQSTQAREFEILGLPRDGTLAEQVVVPAKYIHDKPAHLTETQAAALPLAGVTAYRALFTRGKLQSGETVLVTGVGGGVATLAVQFAVAMGANVLVTSSSSKKIENAIKLGAVAGFDYSAPDWHKKLIADFGPVNLIIDGAGGPGYGYLIDCAAPAGRIVNYGSTAGVTDSIEVRKVFWKQLNLLGTTMGSDLDFENMLRFVSERKIAPVIDCVFPFADTNEAFKKMRSSDQFGKLAVQL